MKEFTKHRMLEYAHLLDDLARVYLPREKEEKEELYASRTELFAGRRMQEQRDVFADFVMQASDQLSDIAETPFADTIVAGKQEKKIIKELSGSGIYAKEYYRAENRNGFTEIGMMAKAQKNTYFEVADIAELISEVIGISMLPAADGAVYVRDEWVMLRFYEETRLRVYGGFAKVTKESETVSGDNYIMREFGEGTYIAAIADGMGSGVEACRDSENLLTFVEKHIESGLSVRSCVRVCDELLYVQYDGERSVSLDMVEINQYTGECTLYKNGGAPSFLIRKNKMKEIAADRLSLGINPRVEGYRETVFLQDQDIVLLASDGVMYLFYDNMDFFESYITGMLGMSLPDLAANILQMAIRAGGGIIRDDMTVLAVGICEKGGLPVAF